MHAQMHVVATAGHVDHGKSTLVRALTGQDPDRLAEEKRRGLSIQLGYCWTTWDGLGDVAFVDVPGHERFLATTLAGMGPVPVVLFVVAADDPWMPQSAEHLAALDALGVDRGVLVVTRADLADPGEALDRARAELDRTTLAGLPSVVVSGRTGLGLDDLRAALSRVLHDVPRPDPATDVRLWVDRRFHVAGAGTVVTGTLPAGTVRVGDELDLDGTVVRVRGVETLGRTVETAVGPARVALRLGGRVPEGLARDSVLVTPGAYERAAVVDVALKASGDAGPLPADPLLHVGATSTSVHVRPLADGWARLVLRRPLPLRYDDRLVLRDPGSRALWGARVRDVAPPALRRRGAAARAQLLSTLDGTVAAEVAARGIVHRDQLRRWGAAQGEPTPGTVGAGGWLVSAERAAELAGRLEELAGAGPHGTTAPAAAESLGLPDPQLVAALLRPPVTLHRGRIVVPSALPARLAPAWERLRDHLAARPFDAPDADTLAALGLDRDDLATLDRAGLVVRLSPTLVLLPDAVQDAAALLRALPQPFAASEARQALGTSRRVALPLLDHLDRTGRTVRLPYDRRRVR